MQDGFISSDNHIFSCISKSFLDTLLKAVLSFNMFKKNHLFEKQYFNEVYLFQIHWDRGIKETLFFESIPQFHISY